MTRVALARTIRCRMEQRERLGRDEWLEAARKALLHGGPSAVRVETLARDLQVTKGSFYWHFRNRQELMEALLVEWETEKTFLRQLVEEGPLDAANLPERIGALFAELERRVTLSERGQWPSDAAIFAWAAVSPRVARRANREELKRIELLEHLTGDRHLAEYIYMAYLGFIVRRRRVRAAAGNFSILAAVTLELLSTRAKPAPRPNAKRREVNA